MTESRKCHRNWEARKAWNDGIGKTDFGRLITESDEDIIAGIEQWPVNESPKTCKIFWAPSKTASGQTQCPAWRLASARSNHTSSFLLVWLHSDGTGSVVQTLVLLNKKSAGTQGGRASFGSVELPHQHPATAEGWIGTCLVGLCRKNHPPKKRKLSMQILESRFSNFYHYYNYVPKGVLTNSRPKQEFFRKNNHMFGHQIRFWEVGWLGSFQRSCPSSSSKYLLIYLGFFISLYESVDLSTFLAILILLLKWLTCMI